MPLIVEAKEWTIEGETNSPQQTNDHDCSVYVCTLAYFLSEGKSMDVIVKAMELIKFTTYLVACHPVIIDPPYVPSSHDYTIPGLIPHSKTSSLPYNLMPTGLHK